MSVAPPVFQEAFRPFSATVVIVLYRVAPANSPAFQSAMESRNHLLSPENVRIVLWDNSPDPPPGVAVPDGVTYLCDPRNLGLVTAYNRALELAVNTGSEWLITLDQDTLVPPDYFLKMDSAARASTQFAGVGSIVPQIQAAGRIVSPNYFQLGAIPRWYRRGFCGVPEEAAFAFNSGAMLSVAALQQIGGYDPWFWLDNSDAQTFSRLHQHGKRVYVAGDIQVQHDFSMKNMEERMSLDRYRGALVAETAFWDLRMNWLGGAERSLRLLLRLIKHRKRKDNPELRKITREALRRRLSMPKAERVSEWKRKTRERLGDSLELSTLHSRRPKISACMAAYNGGRFIDAQLRSILSQLGREDEVLIVDDCSRDDTLERIARFNDPRIRLLRHTKNSGVVETFEDALRSATGDILFLCDDDDVWAPTKIGKFLNVFETRPDVEIVTSRVCLIDEFDVPLPNSRVNRGGEFLPGFWNNLVMNHYQGSAMAIRASVLGRVLPFPRSKLFLHDAWIGTRNEAAGGKTEFIDEDLLFYRRHPQNASGTKSLLRQIKTRLDLLVAHITHAFRLSTL
jgi:GT2 family glycosyltransferase